MTIPGSIPTATRFCHACGSKIDAQANMCRYCGAMQPSLQSAHGNVPMVMTERRILPAFLLCFFLGVFGAHRFYAGKFGTAILQLFTLGGLGIWALVDLIMIATGSFKDKEGHRITEWT